MNTTTETPAAPVDLGVDAPSRDRCNPSITKEQKGNTIMTQPTDNPYPVDSATRPCCGGIGCHTRECSEPSISDGFGKHECEFEWCSSAWRGRDHSYTDYHDATLRHADPYHLTADKARLRIGVGVAYEDDEVPAVVVHLDGGRYDYDADAYLKLTEAVAIRDALDQAIKAATEAFDHWTERMMGGPK